MVKRTSVTDLADADPIINVSSGQGILANNELI